MNIDVTLSGLSPDPGAPPPVPKEVRFFMFLKLFFFLTYFNSETSQSKKMQVREERAMGTGGVSAFGDLAGKECPLASVSPQRCGGGGWVFDEGGVVNLRGTSAPRTASLPPRIPAWRSTSAGMCPGRKG